MLTILFFEFCHASRSDIQIALSLTSSLPRYSHALIKFSHIYEQECQVSDGMQNHMEGNAIMLTTTAFISCIFMEGVLISGRFKGTELDCSERRLTGSGGE